ncbi:MAG: hypothetical protein AAF990_07675 [Bacteroidota bacterium]
MKYSYILLLLLCSWQALAGDGKIRPEKKENVETWIAGEVLAGNTLMTFATVSQGEFLEFVNNNSINSIGIDYFWKSNAGDQINKVGNEYLDNLTTGFDIESWVYPIQNVDTLNGFYLVQVTLNGTNCGPMVPLPIIDPNAIPVEEIPIELPAYNCGDNFVADNISNQSPLISASVGDVFQIYGFPVLIESIQGGNGTFSGEGVVPLPFGNQAVRVDFTDILVNNEYKIYDGQLNAMADDPANYPDFNPDNSTLNIGGEICLPPPPAPGYNSNGIDPATGLDPWGFDENGLHSTTQTPYDPNGFDSDGNHKDTGGPYNDAGCSREGLTEEGNSCDPDEGPNPDADDFADDNEDTIRDTFPDLLQSVLDDIQLELAARDCQSIRDEMEGLVTSLGYSRDFIFGEGDKYFKAGMHEHFNGKPAPLNSNIARNPDAKRLEELHIELYTCDKDADALNAWKGVLDDLMANGQSDFIDALLEKIRTWTTYELEIFGNPVALNEWIIREIGDYMKRNSGVRDALGAVGNPVEKKPSLDEMMKSIFTIDRSAYRYTAASSEMIWNDEFTLEDASFFFRQGEQSTHGIDRAFFLEALGEQQELGLLNGQGGNNYLLPVKVEKTVGNQTYTIYLDNLSIGTAGATLDAYLIITDPESGKRIVFKALGISFGPTGLQGPSTLVLGSNVEIRLNNAAMIILNANGTFVSWDCEGFASMAIDADIEFCRNFIVPLNPSTLEPKPEPERYRLNVVTTIPSWLEFYVTVNAEPFAVAGYETIKWSLTNMLVDFSSTETPAFTPLSGYASPFYDGQAMSGQWKGFYVQNISVKFPTSFSNSGTTITASANDVMIDDCGFSGAVGVQTEILGIDDGNLGGWPFSINRFHLKILKNQFAGSGMGGEINVPIMQENMAYEAVIYPGDQYSFSVSPIQNVTVDMFLATGEIYSNSSIGVVYKDGEFLASANLHGKLSISNGGGNNSISLNLPTVTFDNFVVSNQAPYLSPGNWGMETSGTAISAKFGNFGIAISNIAPYSNAVGSAGLGFDLDIKLVEAIDIEAGGSFGIEGTLSQTNGRQKWEFDQVNVRRVYIDTDFKGVPKIYGELNWFNSTEWGKGFKGVLSVNFRGFDIDLNAAGMFGQKNDQKYFFVDALASLGATGIGTGVLQLKGFGGGVSYGMNADQSQVSPVSQTGDFSDPGLGNSFSGTVYTIDFSQGLGLKAVAVLSTVSEEIFNGTVSLSFSFNSSDNGGGIREIELNGSGQFLKDLDFGIVPDYVSDAISPPSSVNAALSAYINLKFNFNETVFHGNINVFLNAGPVRGTRTGGQLINTEIHFSKTEWYIYVGRPEEGRRCGITFDLPGNFDIEATAYLDVGTTVPPMPRLPHTVREIAYKVNDNQSLRQSGAGFVMGASIKFELGAEIAGIIKGEVKAEAGFDMMLRKYEGLSCQGSNEPVGIDGWYAAGQIWAYVTGQLKVFGVNIIKAGVAAVLQARLPNPFFAQATVGVRVKVLFGTVRKSLKIKLGDDCLLVSSNSTNSLGLEVITALNPFDGASDVETITRPEAFFALALDKEYTVAGLNGDVNFEAKLKSTSLLDSRGGEISHTVDFMEDKQSLKVLPTYELPENDTITFTVVLDIFENGNLLTQETKSTSFTASAQLDYIPEVNVKASYPKNGMMNFYKNENGGGACYLELITGQPSLFYDDDYSMKLRLHSATGEVSTLAFDYDGINNTLNYNLDPSRLTNTGIYKLELIRSTKQTQSNRPTADTPLEMALDGPIQVVEPNPFSNAKSEGIVEKYSTLYTIYFRVSKYNTFEEKMTAIMQSGSNMSRNLANTETFDQYELGDGDSNGWVRFETDLSSNWYKDKAFPVLDAHKDYYCHSHTTNALQLEDPEGSLIVIQTGEQNLSIDRSNFNSNSAPVAQQTLEYGLEKVVQNNRAVSRMMVWLCFHNLFGECSSYPPNSIQMINCELEHDFYKEVADKLIPAMDPGTYIGKASYRLPGRLVQSEEKLQFVK